MIQHGYSSEPLLGCGLALVIGLFIGIIFLALAMYGAGHLVGLWP